MGNSEPHNHEDHIAGKGENSLQHYNLVHKFIPVPQAMKIPTAKAAVDKEWEKLEKISAWNLTKVRSKKQVIDVTAKSRPMMNLIARTPSFVSSSPSSNPGRSSYGYQDPEQPVLDDRAGTPVETSRSNYSQDYGSSWFSQVWKSGNGEHDRSGKPEENSWDSLERVDPHRGEHLLGRTAHSARNEETIHERTGKPDSEDAQGNANFEKFIVGSDTTEFVNKVKNQVRIRQKRMSDDAEDCTEHSIVWGMFMTTTLNAVTFMGKSYSTMQNVVQNEEKITLKQMFDITAQTIHNDEEIYCLDKIVYQRNTWTQLSVINDPVVIGLQSTKVYVFSDSVLCLGKVLQHPECNEAWENRVAGVRAEKNYSDFEIVSGESTEFEWNIFPGFTSLQNQRSSDLYETNTRSFHRKNSLYVNVQ